MTSTRRTRGPSPEDSDRHPRDLLPLHPLEFRILLSLLDRPGHGYRIVKAIEEREESRQTIYPANLYRRIRDLLGKGLLEETEAPADEPDPDPRRTYFTLTDFGRDVARAEAERLRDLVLDATAKDLLEPA